MRFKLRASKEVSVKLSILALVSTVSCIAAAAGCSSSSNKGFGTGPGGGDSGTTTVEGGATDAGGESGVSSLPYVGALSAYKGAAGSFIIAGDFFATPANITTNPTCPSTGTQSGSCCYLPPGAASDAGTSASDAGTPFVSAGTITFSDGSKDLAALNPGTEGVYGITSGASNPSVMWTPGDMLGVSAAGAVVQAFTGTLPTVDDLAVTAPTLSLKTAFPIPIGSDYDVTWTASTATTVHVSLAAYKGGGDAGALVGDGLITCSADDSAGTVTVPTALLSKLTSGDSGLITITRQSQNTVTGPNATVGLTGTATADGLLKFM
jgi:hypothetical protein